MVTDLDPILVASVIAFL
ncbi:hypothetical protein A2U01_0117397, partial [Trifolium medium]|nr:hypothetical protein [Trifolium medium]